MNKVATCYKKKEDDRIHYIVLRGITQYKEKAIEYAGMQFDVQIENHLDITEVMLYPREQKDWSQTKVLSDKPIISTVYYMNYSESIIEESRIVKFIQDLEECDYSQLAKLYLSIDDLEHGTYNSEDHPIIKEIYEQS